MALLKRWRQSPPGGFTYRQAETALTITAENGDALVDQVVAHRVYRNLTPTDRETVRLEIERQICVRLGHSDCRPESKDDPWVPQDGTKPRMGMTQILAFSRAALAFIKSGGALAPMEVVRERAVGCLQCPLNIPLVGCSCTIFYKAVAAAVPDDRKIEGLNLCQACGCSLVAKVNLTDEQIVESNEGRKISWPAQACFQKEIMQRHAASLLRSKDV